MVRLSSSALGRRQGGLLGRGATDIVLSPEPQPIRVPATSIDTLWTRGSSSKTGAIVGGVLLAGFGVLVVTSINQGESDYETGKAAGVLGLGGAVTGGLLGALIGSAIPKWSRRFP